MENLGLLESSVIERLQGKLVYIAGPMRGYEYHNFHTFFEAEGILNDAGVSAVNPARLDCEAGFDSRTLPNTWDWDYAHPEFIRDDCYVRDTEGVRRSDALIMLPGWNYSTGAMMEYWIARFFEKEIYSWPIAEECSPLARKSMLVGEFSEMIHDMHDRSIPFIEAIMDTIALHKSKSHDYGSDSDPYANIRSSEDFGIPAWKGALVRSHDKVVRLKQFCKSGFLNHEAAVDSIEDLCVYFPIILMLFREAEENAAKLHSCDGESGSVCVSGGGDG